VDPYGPYDAVKIVMLRRVDRQGRSLVVGKSQAFVDPTIEEETNKIIYCV
jgi:hypothetical protein